MTNPPKKKQSRVYVNGQECQCISIMIDKDIGGLDRVAMEFYAESIQIKDKNGVDEVMVGI